MMMVFDEVRECPECGALAEQSRWDEFEEGLQFPNCPKGHGRITEEGLLDKVISNADGSKSYVEVGRGGSIICSGGHTWCDVPSLLATILRLQTPEASKPAVVDFAEANARRWNRKKAKRRFKRWLRENDNYLPPIADGRLRELADQLVWDAPERVDTSGRWSFDDISRWGDNDLLSKLKDNEIRTETEPVLLVRGEIPEVIRHSFNEARECYRWGLNGACFGLCRIVLDIVIRVIDETKRDASWPQPLRDEFRAVLHSIPLLSDSERARVSNF
jgi:hypothetical protein